jgi:hypothetical protein
MLKIERDIWFQDDRYRELEYWLEWLYVVRFGDMIWGPVDSGVYQRSKTESVKWKYEMAVFPSGRMMTLD